MSTSYIGVDNGLQGAIAVIRTAPTRIAIFKMPVVGTKKKRLNETALSYILRTAVSDGGTLCTIEAVEPGPKLSRVACMRLGTNQGIVIGILVAFSVPYQIVSARIWQQAMFSGVSRKDTKAASVLVAKRLFPGANLLPTDKCTKEDHNMADALLMAEYGRRTAARGGGSDG